MEKQIEDLNIKINNLSSNNKDISSKDKTSIESKIQSALEEQRIIFKKEIEKRDNKYNDLFKDFINLKNCQGIPTPSNSDDIKNKKILNNNKIVNLPDNILEVVYYRFVKNDKFLPDYHINDGIAYLECCGKQWKYKKLTEENNVTCLRVIKLINYYIKKISIIIN